MARLSFALRMLRQRWDRQRQLCPYCGSRAYEYSQRKWLLIEARKCAHCKLIYRWPTEVGSSTQQFYETDYEGQQATDLPDLDKLVEMRAADFKNTPFDKTGRCEFLMKTIPAQSRVLDFGCSWGYSLHQLRTLGYTVSGYEIDRMRARFGREQLDLDLHSEWQEIEENSVDVIFSDHSFEHVPDPGEVIKFWNRVAHQNAQLVIFVPNGNGQEARKLGIQWGPLLGEVHTLAFTMEWFRLNLPRHGWQPRFFTPDGAPLPDCEYLDDHWEIALVAQRV